MTCNFFTMIKEYCRCCMTRDTTDDTKIADDGNSDISSPFNHYNSDGEQSPFTYDDLTKSISSTSSSSSSLNDYEPPTATKPYYHRTQVNKRPQISPFSGTAPYFSD